MDIIEEPFGPALFADIADLDDFNRKTVALAIQGFNVRAHRAATAARPSNYHGGFVCWEAPRMAEAAR